MKYPTRRSYEKQLAPYYSWLVHFGLLEGVATGETDPKKLSVCMGLLLLESKSWLKAQTNMPLELLWTLP
jgi:hypothetical protein